MSAREAIRREAERPHRDHVGAVQREQTVRRADEFDVVVIAAGAGIAHHLRDRQPLERFVERLLQAANQQADLWPASAGRRSRSCRPTRRKCDPARPRRPASRWRNRDVPTPESFFLSASDGWPDASRATLTGISLSTTSVSGATCPTFVISNGQPPRCRERGDRTRGRQEPAVAQSCDDAVGKGFAEPPQCLRRKFLGEQLHDQRRRRAHCEYLRASRSGNRPWGGPAGSCHALPVLVGQHRKAERLARVDVSCATSRESVRMRPM